MASPLRAKSGERMWIPPPDNLSDYRPMGLHNSYIKGNSIVVEKENDYPLRARSRSPLAQHMASTAAESRYLLDKARHQQYVSRYTLPPPEPIMYKPISVPVPSVHQDYFMNELQQEVNELRGRQRDYAALQDQFRYLQEQYKNVQFEKTQFESDCLNKISQDRQEVDMLIRELDQVKAENYQTEDEQIRLLEQIGVTERDTIQASGELSEVRAQCSSQDMANLNLQKDVEYTEKLLAEQKDINYNQYQELTRNREVMFNLDKDLEAQSKRCDILRIEIENNQQRIQSINDLINSKEEAISRTQFKIGEAMQQVQDLKYTLNKLDGELGYFENQNEQHKAAQSQMFKANEYEYMQGKDHGLKHQELEIQMNKITQDEKSVSYEIDRLKQHSDQMLKDQIELQAEIDALDKHMANLNNQNYCLQKELEEFVQADDAVRRNLDRKNKVDHIRQRVDDVIARSQAEVEHQRRERAAYHKDAAFLEQEAMDMKRMERARSANQFSPREMNFRKQAWAPEEDLGRNQMSFGRDKFEREARFAAMERERDLEEEEYRRASGSPLRNKSSPRARSYGRVRFA